MNDIRSTLTLTKYETPHGSPDSSKLCCKITDAGHVGKMVNVNGNAFGPNFFMRRSWSFDGSLDFSVGG